MSASPKKDQRPGVFGVNLLKYRKARGLSQQKLSELAGIGRVTIANLERGAHKSPDGETVASLATALGVPQSALWAPDSSSEPPVSAPLSRMPLESFLEAHGDELTGHERRILEGLRSRPGLGQTGTEGDWWELVRLIREEFPPKLGGS